MARFLVALALLALVAVAFGAPQRREERQEVTRSGTEAKSGDLDTASSFYGGFYGGFPYGGYGYGGFGGPFYGGYGGFGGYGYGHPYGGFGYGFY